MSLSFRDNPDNILGADSDNNQFASTNVVANEDGSMVERLEALQKATEPRYGAPNHLAVPRT